MKPISLSPSGTGMKGTMEWTTTAVAVGMDALLCSSAARRVLKPSSGMYCRVAAISTKPAGPSGAMPFSTASMARSSCSMSARSGTGDLHLSAQALDGTELKLLHGSFAAPQFLRNLADAFLLHEAQMNYAELRFRKPVH